MYQGLLGSSACFISGSYRVLPEPAATLPERCSSATLVADAAAGEAGTF